MEICNFGFPRKLIFTTPTELNSTPSEFNSVPREFNSSPLEFISTPLEFNSTPPEFNSARLKLNSTPTETIQKGKIWAGFVPNSVEFNINFPSLPIKF